MIRILLPSLLLVAVAALAQEPAPDETTAAGADVEDVPAAETGQADETTERAEPASTPRQAPEDYRPSEEISEDLSVSFPVDI